jgi:antitoxin CptB
MNHQKRDLFIKKLLYQSCNRGCKENDIIIGGFARHNLTNMTDDELNEFAAILELPDVDIYDWYTGKKPIPKNKNTELMQKIVKFSQEM